METESGWATDDDLRAARERFAAGIPGYLEPAAYGVARVDDGELSFGEINDVGSAHRLPPAVLASVCGYAGATGTFELTTEQMTEAAHLLAPAEAAVHWDHPNLVVLAEAFGLAPLRRAASSRSTSSIPTTSRWTTTMQPSALA